MSHILENKKKYKSVRIIQEAFNPASFSLYYSLRFKPAEILLELFLENEVESSLGSIQSVKELTLEGIDAVNEYGISRCNINRQTDLTYYVNWGKVFAYQKGIQIRGFLACLAGTESVALGPFITEEEEDAVILLKHALSAYKGRHIRTRVNAKNNFLIDKLKKLGFKLFCVDNLMVHGEWSLNQCVEGYGFFPEGF